VPAYNSTPNYKMQVLFSKKCKNILLSLFFGFCRISLTKYFPCCRMMQDTQKGSEWVENTRIVSCIACCSTPVV